MTADRYAPIELRDLQKLIIPPRSRLYHLAPIGGGTPYVESLTGYIARLAETHGVTTGMLILSEIAPLAKEGYVFDGKDKGLSKIYGNPESTKALNGTGKWASSMVQALELLTLHSNLRFLTMLPWTEVLSQQGLLRPIRTWCPTCYNNCRVAEQPVYEMLLWSLNVVTICPRHHQHLCSRCPHCQQANQVLEWRSRPGYCVKCGGWLGISANAELPNNVAVTENELKWQNWVVKNVGELVAAASGIPSPPLRENVANNLCAYINNVAEGSVATFARRLRISYNQIYPWSTGKTLPKIKTILQICDFSGTSLLDFLTKEAVVIDFDMIAPTNNLPKGTTRRNWRKFNLSQAQQVLESALNEYPPPTLTEVARRLGYRKSTSFSYYYPDLCNAIKTQYRDYQKAQGLEKTQPVLEAALKSEEYPPPSIPQVARRVGIHSSVLRHHQPDLCRAISARYVNYQRELSIKKLQEFRQEVWQVALKLHAEEVEPNIRNVSAHLTNPLAFLQKGAIKVLNEVLFELGLKK